MCSNVFDGSRSFSDALGPSTLEATALEPAGDRPCAVNAPLVLVVGISLDRHECGLTLRRTSVQHRPAFTSSSSDVGCLATTSLHDQVGNFGLEHVGFSETGEAAAGVAGSRAAGVTNGTLSRSHPSVELICFHMGTFLSAHYKNLSEPRSSILILDSIDLGTLWLCQIL